MGTTPLDYTWALYPHGDVEYAPGDVVFVILKSQRETGRACVIEAADPESGRVRVRFDLNGSTARVRPARLIPVLPDRLRAGDAAAATAAADAMVRLDCEECSSSGGNRTAADSAAAAADQNARLAVVVSSTDDFRRMARSQVARDESVLEIGCSAGGATAVLAQQASSVVGVDVSHELLEQARERVTAPNVQLEWVDALGAPEPLLALGKGRQAVFIDIGGNRDLGPLLSLLDWVAANLAPRLIVVKNEPLAEAAAEHLASERSSSSSSSSSSGGGGGGGEAAATAPAAAAHPIPPRLPGAIADLPGFWQALRSRPASAAPACGSNPLFEKAKAGGWRVAWNRFPDRTAPGTGRRICRPFNYQTCHAGAACEFDHAHCHNCLAAGHAARDCGGGGGDGGAGGGS